MASTGGEDSWKEMLPLEGTSVPRAHRAERGGEAQVVVAETKTEMETQYRSGNCTHIVWKDFGSSTGVMFSCRGPASSTSSSSS